MSPPRVAPPMDGRPADWRPPFVAYVCPRCSIVRRLPRGAYHCLCCPPGVPLVEGHVSPDVEANLRRIAADTEKP